MIAGKVLIAGSGHLASRLRTLAQARGLEVVRWTDALLSGDADQHPRFESIRRALANVDLASVSAAVLVDEQDERNLELAIVLTSMHPRLPIAASMFNENIAPHLQAASPSLRVLSPARIAAQAFVNALDQPLEHDLRYTPRPPAPPWARVRRERFIPALVAGFVLALFAAAAYFHQAEHLSWLDALYFVVVTTATVGYGDISLAQSSPMSKVVGIALIFTSTVFIWMIFSLTVDKIIRHRVQMALGRRRHTQRGHVILCGAGRLGYLVGEALLKRRERVLVVELRENLDAVEHLRSLGADIYVGDARSPRVLEDAGVRRAKALYSLVANDFVNLEIGLNARSFDPRLRLILRIFDESMAQRIKEQLDIHLSFSMSAIADEHFLDCLEAEPATGVTPTRS
jgi:voltage-gated potassium channel Kch